VWTKSALYWHSSCTAVPVLPYSYSSCTAVMATGDGCAGPDRRVWAGMRYPSEQLCTVSAADRGADVQFAPEGFAPRWSLPSPFHDEEAKLPKGCGAFRTADQTISSHFQQLQLLLSS
jgi:hypothetical protein